MTQPAEAPQATETVAAPDQQIAAHEADDRAAMIAAVEAAGFEPEVEAKTDGEEKPAAPGRDATGKFLPKKEPAATETEAAPHAESKIAVAIRAREAAQKTRDTAKAEAESFFNDTKARAEKEAERIISEAKQRAEREVGEWRAKFKATPLQAIKDQGIDTRTLVDEVQREGSPEWQAQKRIEKALEESRAELEGLKAWKEEQSGREKTRSQQEKEWGQRQAEQRYVASIPEDSPLRKWAAQVAELTDTRPEAFIIAETYKAAQKYETDTNGEVASDEDLRQYLEELAAKKLATTDQAAKKQAPGSAAKTKANGPRTPSSSSASERRTSPKPFADLRPEEERDALKAAADDAMSAYVKT